MTTQQWPDAPAEPAPATPAEAEELAKRFVSEYLTACRLNAGSQIGDYLMKLTSVAGVFMANAEGSSMAAARLMSTASFIAQNMPDSPAKIVRVQ